MQTLNPTLKNVIAEKDIPYTSEHIVHEYVVHKSLATLILKGGLAWLLMAAACYLLDRLPDLAGGLNYQLTVTPASLAAFHLILNVLYGWLLFYVVLSWYLEYFVVSKGVLITRQGIMFVKEEAFPVDDIKTINVTQSFFQRLFKEGTVHIYFWRQRRWIRLTDIHDPHSTAALIIHSQRVALKGGAGASEKEEEDEIID